MPVQKTITLYTYDELPTEKAKDIARNWWRECYDASDAMDMVKEDARQIGLTIESLGCNRGNLGEFADGAFNCANKIISDHGKDCATYKTAAKYQAAWDDVPDQITNLEEESRNAESIDAIEGEFLSDLLEDYRVMMEQEIEYQNSDEAVNEMLRDNQYTFRENGTRDDA